VIGDGPGLPRGRRGWLSLGSAFGGGPNGWVQVLSGKPGERLLGVVLGQVVEVPNRIERETGPGGLREDPRFSDGGWAQSDLNRRPPGYQPGAPAKLSYGPRRQGNRPNLSLSGQLTPEDLSRQFDTLAERTRSARSSTDGEPNPSAPGPFPARMVDSQRLASDRQCR
jgi:hypothetical protein